MYKLLWLFIIVGFAQADPTNPQNPGSDDWWKHGVFYQVYPRSFKDSNNDGDGDLKGILEKVPHFKDAGITGVWISPIMQSPQVDQGYDISDYNTIDPMYGDMDDFMQLVKAVHDAGIKLILDFVPNHTSNQHEWFLASENGTEEYKDYYVWVDAKEDGSPPNNWISVFGNSSWEWSEKRKQYYLHEFLIQQPDLNYRNPAVQKSMKDVMTYWMDMGVDGFRIDAVPFLTEDPDFKDEPRTNDPNSTDVDYGYLDHIYTTNQPDTYKVVYDWREHLDNYTKQNGGDARIMMTEVYANETQTMLYFGTADGSTLGAHFTFNFNLITDLNLNDSNAHDVETSVHKWLDNIPDIYTSNWVLGNHDQRRIPTRLGLNNTDGFNMLMTLLPGIGVTYNGEEFAQADGEVTYEQGRDPSARNRSTFEKVSRDFERTPLQWDNTTNAGFNDGATPWLPVSEKYLYLNLASQQGDGVTHYKNYQALLKLRQLEPAVSGDTKFSALSDDIVLLERSKDSVLYVVFKLGWDKGSYTEQVAIPDLKCSTGSIVLTSVNSTHTVGDKLDLTQINLQASEALVIQADSKC